MSILIKGMEMPTNCWDCPLINTSPCACKGYSTALEHVTDRHTDCPLVPVPPHGRLIDADALIVDLMDRGVEGLQTDDWHEIQQAVVDAPTIIPAEEGE